MRLARVRHDTSGVTKDVEVLEETNGRVTRVFWPLDSSYVVSKSGRLMKSPGHPLPWRLVSGMERRERDEDDD